MRLVTALCLYHLLRGCVTSFIFGAMQDLMKSLVVVLVRPRFPENIGAAARAVANMGIGGLRVVSPLRLWDKPMRRLATEHGSPVLEAMERFENLEDALADCVAGVATTARLGTKRGRLLPPRQGADQVMAWARDGRVALVFGPEDRGLDTHEVDLCQISFRIPTAEMASLNLAQAVIVVAYEMRLCALEQNGQTTSAERQLASHQEVELLKSHLKEALVAIGAMLPENPDHFFRHIKNVLDRAGLSSREVRNLHGLARQILWLRSQIKD